MAQTASLSTLDVIRSALQECANSHGWADSDCVVVVEPGSWNDIHIRFGAKALDHGQTREAIKRDIWDFIKSRLPHAEFSRISMFGGEPLERFRKLHPEYFEGA
jgi:hypothetical protein